MREIEAKFLVPAIMSKPEMDHLLRTILPAVSRESHGQSADYYFNSVGTADFARLRVSGNGYEVELCSKKKDGTDNINRSEIAVQLGPEQGGIASLAFMRSVLGREICVLRKTYTRFSIDGGMEVSTATVEGFDHVILEVEGAGTGEMWQMAAHIRTELGKLSQPIGLMPEQRSLYEMFVKPLRGMP